MCNISKSMFNKLNIVTLFIIIVLTIFTSCSKSVNSTSNNDIKIPESTKNIPFTLPLEDKNLVERIALRGPGVGTPIIKYASENILVVYDYWGLIVYDLNQKDIVRAIDFKETGFNCIQGENYRQITINNECTKIHFKAPLQGSEPSWDYNNYIYDVLNDNLYTTKLESLDDIYKGMVYNMNETEYKDDIEWLKKEIDGVLINEFSSPNIAIINDNKYAILDFDCRDKIYEVRKMLKIYIVDNSNHKIELINMFKNYNNLVSFPTLEEIKKEHVPIPTLNNDKDIKFDDELPMVFENKKLDSFEKVYYTSLIDMGWKEIEKNQKLFSKKINGYDIELSVSMEEVNNNVEVQLWCY